MRRSPSPGRLKFIPPQLPRLVETPPESHDWIHEIKYDGYRTQVIIDWDGARAYTKTGIDWTSRYWPIVTAAEALGARSAIIDGEVIAPTPNGAPDFHAVGNGMECRTAGIRGFRSPASRRQRPSVAANH
jgi:ATP-dependent DNA ligase